MILVSWTDVPVSFLKKIMKGEQRNNLIYLVVSTFFYLSYLFWPFLGQGEPIEVIKLS